jgi:hypothetical protein
MRLFPKSRIVLALLLLACSPRVAAQLVTINETLQDSQGNNLAGTLYITTVPYRLPIGTAKTIVTPGCTNATPINVTATSHGFSNGHVVYITGVLGNLACNGTFRVTNVDANNFTLDGSTGSGAWASGGTAQRLLSVGPSRRTYTVTAGVVNLSLYPTTTGIAIPGDAAAGFTHQVVYQLNDGASFTERWSIPPTPTTTTVTAIQKPGVLNPTAKVDLAQLGQGSAGDTRNDVPCWDGSVWKPCLVNIAVNTQAGTSYTVLDTDRNKIATFSNTSAVAVTLPQAGATSQFLSGWYAWFRNLNTGAVTITPTTSTIDGFASYKLRTGQSILVVSDGTNYLVHNGAVNNAPRSLFTSTADRTQANSTSELTIIGTGVGTLTLPANFYDVAGKSLKIHAAGYYSNTGTPTLTFKVKHGSTVLGSTGAITTTTGATNWQWTFDGLITCRTVGGSGTCIVQGSFLINDSATTDGRYQMVNTAAVTVNTTVTQVVDLTIQWGTASASNTITGSNFADWAVETPLP